MSDPEKFAIVISVILEARHVSNIDLVRHAGGTNAQSDMSLHTHTTRLQCLFSLR